MYCNYKKPIDANLSVPTTFLIQCHFIVEEGRELMPFDGPALNVCLVRGYGSSYSVVFLQVVGDCICAC